MAPRAGGSQGSVRATPTPRNAQFRITAEAGKEISASVAYEALVPEAPVVEERPRSPGIRASGPPALARPASQRPSRRGPLHQHYGPEDGDGEEEPRPGQGVGRACL